MAVQKETEQAVKPWWRRREPMHQIGYILSAIWMGGIVVATKGDTKHFLFSYVFLVPLAGWVLGLGIAAFLRHRAKK